jgi:hypothetical protein
MRIPISRLSFIALGSLVILLYVTVYVFVFNSQVLFSENNNGDEEDSAGIITENQSSNLVELVSSGKLEEDQSVVTVKINKFDSEFSGMKIKDGWFCTFEAYQYWLDHPDVPPVNDTFFLPSFRLAGRLGHWVSIPNYGIRFARLNGFAHVGYRIQTRDPTKYWLYPDCGGIFPVMENPFSFTVNQTDPPLPEALQLKKREELGTMRRVDMDQIDHMKMYVKPQAAKKMNDLLERRKTDPSAPGSYLADWSQSKYYFFNETKQYWWRRYREGTIIRRWNASSESPLFSGNAITLVLSVRRGDIVYPDYPYLLSRLFSDYFYFIQLWHVLDALAKLAPNTPVNVAIFSESCAILRPKYREMLNMTKEALVVTYCNHFGKPTDKSRFG